MNDIHLGGLDLNLLRVLSVLLEERNVTRAGARLGVTQSAVSHALGRLREALGDPLLVRGDGAMQPTARGAEIGAALPAALARVYRALSLAPFNPAASERTFTIVAGSYVCAVFMPALMARLRREAPRVRLEIRNFSSDMIERLDRGDIDLIISGAGAAPARLGFEPLLEESIVWIVRARNPIARAPLTIEALARAAHVLVGNPQSAFQPRENAPARGAQSDPAWIDDGAFLRALEARGFSPHVALVVPDTYSAIAIVSQSDMVALAPRRLALMRAPVGAVKVFTPPYPDPTPSRSLGLIVRPDHAENPALAWLIDRMRRTAAGLRSPRLRRPDAGANGDGRDNEGAGVGGVSDRGLAEDGFDETVVRGERLGDAGSDRGSLDGASPDDLRPGVDGAGVGRAASRSGSGE